MKRRTRKRLILILIISTFVLVSCEAYVIAHIPAVVIKQTRMEI